jgi:signal transduction histidine kinase
MSYEGERELGPDVEAEQDALLSATSAPASQRRLALAVVAVSTALFAAAAPFARLPLAAAPAFLPAYEAALIIIELITAVLLFGQFGMLRRRSILVLAGAYLFSGLMALAHLLSFPGLFPGSALPGIGTQTTAWLYFLWHGGFPLLVLGYALLANRVDAHAALPDARLAIAGAALSVLALVCVLAALTTLGHAALPVIMAGDSDAPAKVAVAMLSWLLCVAALVVLWRRQPHSVLDLWLMVVLCAWIFDIALAAVLNAGRFDLGWYAGRIYGLLAGSFVLMVLLLENSALYAQRLKAYSGERRERQRVLNLYSRRLKLLHEVDRGMIRAASTSAIAEAALKPLRDLLGVPRAIVNLFDLQSGEAEWLAAVGRQRVHVGPGVRYPIALMGDVEALRRGETQVIDARALPDSPHRTALLASGVLTYMAVPMIVGDELIGALSFGGEAADFPEDKVEIAREVAAQLGIAVSHARLYERVKRQAEHLELRVKERTEELEVANHELEAFSYSVSHDLRAPVRAMNGFAGILAEEHAAALGDEGRRLLGVIIENSRHMGALIDDLLRFAKLSRDSLNRAPLDMTDLVRTTWESLQPHAGVAFELSSLPSAYGDAAMLRQVWINLLSNALKYSGKRDAPRIAVSGSRTEAEVIYSVSDNGVGFDMRYYDKLFGVFRRLHGHSEFPGTGVGLAIVHRVVTRHGGRAWAEGRVDEGAKFFFSLPTVL